jgi:hypothetical protein
MTTASADPIALVRARWRSCRDRDEAHARVCWLRVRGLGWACRECYERADAVERAANDLIRAKTEAGR